MTQLSENPHLNPVFANLLAPEGSEIYLKPVVDYVRPDMQTDFYTVVESARRQGQVAIGYRLQGRSAESDSGIVLNPDKREHVRFTPNDKVIVLAED